MRKTDKYQHASIIKNHNVLYSFPSSHFGGEDDARKTDRAWDKSLENFANKGYSRDRSSPEIHEIEVQCRWKEPHLPDLCLPCGPQAHLPTLSPQSHFENRSKPQVSTRQESNNNPKQKREVRCNTQSIISTGALKPLEVIEAGYTVCLSMYLPSKIKLVLHIFVSISTLT